MSENGAPKLFIHKPKKAAQVKQSRGNVAKDFFPQQVSMPPPPSSATSPSAPVKESFVRRYKYLWPLLLTVNLAYGGFSRFLHLGVAFLEAYLYKRIKKQDASGEEENLAAATNSVIEKSAPSVVVSASPVSTQASAIAGQTALSSATTTPQNACARVPEDQQRELFKWILDEKRKIQPKNTEEKKPIDTEKAVLKKFIRAESISIV